jgi:hypothetical protein
MPDSDEVKAAARDAYLAGLRDGAKGAKPELTPPEKIQQTFWGIVKGLFGLAICGVLILIGLSLLR